MGEDNRVTKPVGTRFALTGPAKAVLIVAGVVVLLLGVVIVKALTHKSVATGASQPNSASAGNDSQDGTAALWDANQHGILVLEGSQPSPAGVGTLNIPATLALIDPSNGNVLAQVALPTPQQTTLDGKNLSLDNGTQNFGSFGSYQFNSTYQYIAAQFSQASDGSQDVGYYDLATSKVTDISPKSSSSFSAQTVSDTGPSFSPTNPNLLEFQRNGQNYAYNIATGQSQLATQTAGPIPSCVGYQSSACILVDQSGSPSIGITTRPQDDDNSVTDDPADNPNVASGNGYQELGISNNGTFVLLVQGVNQDGSLQSIDCTPVEWLDSKNILCARQNGFVKVDVVDRTEMPAGSSYSYSDAYYKIAAPVSLLQSNDRTNTSPVLSPDRKTIAFISSQGSSAGLYTVPVSGGQPKEVAQLTSGTYTPGIVAWR